MKSRAVAFFVRLLLQDASFENLYGELPALFKSEEELRKIWSDPKTRKKLLEGLEEKGFGVEALKAVGELIEAEDSDIFDVLGYVAFAVPPISREERVHRYRHTIHMHFPDKRKEFLDFVLENYISQGVGELDTEKLPSLLELKYHSIADAVNKLGAVGEIKDAFIGFQMYLYLGNKAA